MKQSSTEKMKVGELLLQHGLINEKQIEQAVVYQAAQSNYKLFGEACIELGFVSRRDLRRLLAKHRLRILLGELLLRMGYVSDDQLRQCIEAQSNTGKKIGEIFVENGFASQARIADALSRQLGISKITPHARLVDRSLTEGRNPSFFLKKRVVPVSFDKETGVLTVIMEDPVDAETIADLKKVFKTETVRPVLSASGDLKGLLRDLFGEEALAYEREQEGFSKSQLRLAPDHPAGKDLSGSKFMPGTAFGASEPKRKAAQVESKQVENKDDSTDVLDFIVTAAMKQNASDIYIELQTNRAQVGYRIDDSVQPGRDLSLASGSALVDKIKAMCGFEAARVQEHRTGRIRTVIMGNDVDLRVSIAPGTHGENVTLKIQYTDKSLSISKTDIWQIYKNR